MVVPPHFFFDEGQDASDSGLDHFAELEDYVAHNDHAARGLWLLFSIVFVSVLTATIGFGLGLFATLEQRGLISSYLASAGLDSLPAFEEELEEEPMHLGNFDDTTVHALEMDMLINKSLDLEKKVNALEEENRYLTMAKSSLENVLEGDFLSFESEELGISFEYPAKFGEIELVIDESVKVNGEQWGGKFRGSFANNQFLKFGGAAVNYGSDGKLRFLDYGRFDGKGFIGNAVLIEIIEADGPRISVFKGMDNHNGALKKGELGALLEIDGGEFKSMAVHLTDEDKLSYEDFKMLLESLVVE